MESSPLSVLFSSVGLFYLVFLPVIAIQFFGLLAVPALLKPGTHLTNVGHALFSYACQTAGIIFMTVGGIPTFYSVLASQSLSSGTYASLLVIFAAGGILYLWHDAALQRIDAASRAVPEMIFACAWKFIGLTDVVLSLLSFMLRILLQNQAPTGGWWIMHLALLLYGVLLTHADVGKSPASVVGFQSQQMGGVAAKKKKK